MNIIESTVATPEPLDMTLYGRLNKDGKPELLTLAEVESEVLSTSDFLAVRSATAAEIAAVGMTPLFVCHVTVRGAVIPALASSPEMAFRSALTLRAVGASITPGQQDFLDVGTKSTTTQPLI